MARNAARSFGRRLQVAPRGGIVSWLSTHGLGHDEHDILNASRLLAFGFLFGCVLSGVGDPADHHLFPSLVAPADIFFRIRFGEIVLGIVEVRDAVQRRTLGNGDRRLPMVGLLTSLFEAF